MEYIALLMFALLILLLLTGYPVAFVLHFEFGAS